jgi:hypothetical protein
MRHAVFRAYVALALVPFRKPIPAGGGAGNTQNFRFVRIIVVLLRVSVKLPMTFMSIHSRSELPRPAFCQSRRLAH